MRLGDSAVRNRKSNRLLHPSQAKRFDYSKLGVCVRRAYNFKCVTDCSRFQRSGCGFGFCFARFFCSLFSLGIS